MSMIEEYIASVEDIFSEIKEKGGAPGEDDVAELEEIISQMKVEVISLQVV
jgi:hypothetical protein